MEKIKNGIYIVKGREIIKESFEQGDAVLLITDHASIIIAKKEPSQTPWDKAMNYCEENNVRLPNRHEALEMAIHHEKINEALEAIGGDRIQNDWYWTSEERSSNCAWGYYGNGGSMGYGNKYGSYSVRPVTAF